MNPVFSIFDLNQRKCFSVNSVSRSMMQMRFISNASNSWMRERTSNAQRFSRFAASEPVSQKSQVVMQKFLGFLDLTHGAVIIGLLKTGISGLVDFLIGLLWIVYTFYSKETGWAVIKFLIRGNDELAAAYSEMFNKTLKT